MRKSINYFLSFFAFAAILFLASCGEDGELPIPGDDEIDFSTDAGAIDGDTLRAAPGDSIAITASLGIASNGEITVTTDDNSIVTVPTPNVITSGDAITVTVPASATIGQMATLTFQSEGVTDQLTVVVGYTNVLAAARSIDSLSTFVEAVEAAGLEETLMGDGPFTVFAPSNTAFENLLGSLGMTLEELISGEDLESILLYHVISGSAAASGDLEDGQTLTTAHPDGLSSVVTISGETVMINNAAVTAADIETDNGIVHIIDDVLMPQTVVTYETVLLQAPNSNRESETFFGVMNGMRYTMNDVINSSENISDSVDFGYYFGQQNAASLASPSVYPTGVYDLTAAGWSTLNETLFVPTNNLSPEDFDAIADNEAYRLVQEYEVGVAAGDPTAQITQLEVGQSYAFLTASGQYGILRVDEITEGTGTEGSISLTVKAATE